MDAIKKGRQLKKVNPEVERQRKEAQMREDAQAERGGIRGGRSKEDIPRSSTVSVGMSVFALSMLINQAYSLWSRDRQHSTAIGAFQASHHQRLVSTFPTVAIGQNPGVGTAARTICEHVHTNMLPVVNDIVNDNADSIDFAELYRRSEQPNIMMAVALYFAGM